MIEQIEEVVQGWWSWSRVGGAKTGLFHDMELIETPEEKEEPEAHHPPPPPPPPLLLLWYILRLPLGDSN